VKYDWQKVFVVFVVVVAVVTVTIDVFVVDVVIVIVTALSRLFGLAGRDSSLFSFHCPILLLLAVSSSS